MTVNQSNLPVTNLDFDSIRASLKEYLQGQDTFSDYNFEGSGLSVLLDLLAYNTHINSFLANMASREAYIGSAQIRSSLVSIAKQLGYVPRSKTAATAVLSIDFGATAPVKTNGQQRRYVEVGDVFTATVSGSSYTFVALENYPIVQDETGNYVATNVSVKEGSIQFFSYLYDTSSDSLKFEIPTSNADISTLKVRVQASKLDTTGLDSLWERAENVVLVNSETKVYFIQENSIGRYEVYFGDGIAGKALQNGNVVVLQYLVTSGKDANGVGQSDAVGSRVFTYDLYPLVDVEVTDYAAGGDDPESNESIRFYAPLAYQAQLRAVTPDDYRAIIAREYGNIESVMVWGGEDSVPPEYGKVFISLKPRSGYTITDSEKLAIKESILASKNVVSITPEIVNPDYIYIGFATTVYYNPTATTLNASAIEDLVYNEIIRYADEELDKFERNFRYSKFIAGVDNLLTAINSSNVDITLTKRFEPAIGQSSSYEIDFQNAIFHPQDDYPPIVTSSGFGYIDPDTGTEYDSYFDDDGNGVLRIYHLVNSEKVYLNEDAGTVDYDTGEIVVTNFNPSYIVPPYITDIAITVTPRTKDIITHRNQILTIDPDTLETAITISAISETIRQDPYSSSGLPFPFDSE